MTRPSVYRADRAAEGVITIGGFVVLAAVLAICVYLLATVLPLFRGGSATLATAARSAAGEGAAALAVCTDEYTNAAAALCADGRLRVVLLSDGMLVDERHVADDVSAASDVIAGGPIAVGLSTGSVRLGDLGFDARLLKEDELTPEIRAASIGGVVPVTVGGERGIAQRLDEQRVRFSVARLALNPPADLGEGEGAVRVVDARSTASGERFLVALRADGTGVFSTARTIRPLGGGKPRTTLDTARLDLAADPVRGQPAWLLVTADGLSVLAVWRDGMCRRFAPSLRGSGVVPVVEETRVVAPGRSATCVAMLLGGRTLLVGDDAGEVRAFVPGRDEGAGATDGLRLVECGEARVGVGAGAVVSITSSPRTRLFAAGTDRGAVAMFHMTSGKELARVEMRDRAPARVLTVAPKGDALLALSDAGWLEWWRLEPGAIEVSARSLFGRVVYEGQSRPAWVWQSSSADDTSEPKYSLVPLIFGTLKATVVAMLIAAPLAVLSAIYSSEFMHKRARAVVKPVVEMMASVPSVVLGFVAAMVVAPVAAERLGAILVGVTLVPVSVAGLAHAWQLAPRALVSRLAKSGPLMMIACAAACGIALTVFASGPVERWLFASDAGFRGWLEARSGRAWAGWVPVFTPPGVALAWFAASRVAARRRRSSTPREHGARVAAALELAKFGAVVASGVAAAAAVSFALGAIGVDARDSIFGPFSQRNTLVVGIVMAMAIVPIIYTIAEDALRAVPQQLRSASLGVGATPWQTAVRVVLPAAGSGVFSACMIGLGRAVGETMVVLMATGNTPEISSNLFSGMRTLAANIAVELPEAPAGGTHYRVLVLCGLVLFVMTFVINTTAEVVRQRVRRRTAAL